MIEGHVCELCGQYFFGGVDLFDNETKETFLNVNSISYYISRPIYACPECFPKLVDILPEKYKTLFTDRIVKVDYNET